MKPPVRRWRTSLGAEPALEVDEQQPHVLARAVHRGNRVDDEQPRIDRVSGRGHDMEGQRPVEDCPASPKRVKVDARHLGLGHVAAEHHVLAPAGAQQRELARGVELDVERAVQCTVANREDLTKRERGGIDANQGDISGGEVLSRLGRGNPAQRRVAERRSCQRADLRRNVHVEPADAQEDVGRRARREVARAWRHREERHRERVGARGARRLGAEEGRQGRRHAVRGLRGGQERGADL